MNIKFCLVLIVGFAIGANCEDFNETIYTSDFQAVDSDLCVEFNYKPIFYDMTQTDAVRITTEGVDDDGNKINKTIDEFEVTLPSRVWKTHFTTASYENPGAYKISMMRKYEYADIALTFYVNLYRGKCQSS